MKKDAVDIQKAVEVLQVNLDKAGSISEWAELMGYDSYRGFQRKFVKHFKKYPGRVLKFVRIVSILKALRFNDESLLQIAISHSLPDDNAVNGMINYHFECSPTDIREMPPETFQKCLRMYYEKLELPPQIPPPRFLNGRN